jgi:hypothetical protein
MKNTVHDKYQGILDKHTTRDVLRLLTIILTEPDRRIEVLSPNISKLETVFNSYKDILDTGEPIPSTISKLLVDMSRRDAEKRERAQEFERQKWESKNFFLKKYPVKRSRVTFGDANATRSDDISPYRNFFLRGFDIDPKQCQYRSNIERVNFLNKIPEDILFRMYKLIRKDHSWNDYSVKRSRASFKFITRYPFYWLKNIYRKTLDHKEKKYVIKLIKYLYETLFTDILELENVEKKVRNLLFFILDAKQTTNRITLLSHLLTGDFWKCQETSDIGFLIFCVLPQWIRKYREDLQKAQEILQALSELLAQPFLTIRYVFIFQRRLSP